MKLYCIYVVIWCVLYETRKFVSVTLCLLQVEFVNYGFKNRFFDPKNLGKYICYVSFEVVQPLELNF